MEVAPATMGVNNDEVSNANLWSAWEIHEVAVWDKGLSEDAVDTLVYRYLARLSIGADSEKGLWTRPPFTWANSRTRIGQESS